MFTLSKYIQCGLCMGLISFILFRLHLNGQYGFRDIEMILINVYLLVDIFRVCFTFIQCIWYHRDFQEIIDIYEQLQLLFLQYFGHILSFKSFHKLHLFNVANIVVYYTLYGIVYVVIRQWKYGISPLCIPIALLKLLQTLSMLHIIFYTDLLSFHLAELNSVLKKNILELGRSNRRMSLAVTVMKSKLFFCKKIHFGLYQASQVQNRVFGWCTLASVLRIFIDLVYAAFWLFDEFSQLNEFVRILRK